MITEVVAASPSGIQPRYENELPIVIIREVLDRLYPCWICVLRAAALQEDFDELAGLKCLAPVDASGSSSLEDILRSWSPQILLVSVHIGLQRVLPWGRGSDSIPRACPPPHY